MIMLVVLEEMEGMLVKERPLNPERIENVTDLELTVTCIKVVLVTPIAEGKRSRIIPDAGIEFVGIKVTVY